VPAGLGDAPGKKKLRWVVASRDSLTIAEAVKVAAPGRTIFVDLLGPRLHRQTLRVDRQSRQLIANVQEARGPLMSPATV
jgi:hypothetical protein